SGYVTPDDGTAAPLPERLRRATVAFNTSEAPGTIVIDTGNTALYYVLGQGRAIRYGVGVGREGFTWAGVQSISRKAEWPDWRRRCRRRMSSRASSGASAAPARRPSRCRSATIFSRASRGSAAAAAWHIACGPATAAISRSPAQTEKAALQPAAVSARKQRPK